MVERQEHVLSWGLVGTKKRTNASRRLGSISVLMSAKTYSDPLFPLSPVANGQEKFSVAFLSRCHLLECHPKS